MATGSSTKMKRAEQLEEILGARGRAAPTKEVKAEVAVDNRFKAIESNPFYAAVFSEATSPEEKQKAVEQLLTFTGTREENRERVKAFDLFKEFLQAEREAMASKIISMSDTENFATLKSIFDDINGALIEFEEDMKPLTDIIDALHVLRQNNQSMDAFREIKDDEKRQAAQEQRQRELDAEIARVNEQIDQARARMNAAANEKKFFGFGGLTDNAVQTIARAEVDVENGANALREIERKRQEARNENQANSTVDQHAKEKLKEMLNLTSDEHRDRSKALISSALNFVETSKAKIGQVRHELGHMGDQILNLEDANGQMTMIYAILGEGVKGAENQNREIRTGIMTPKAEENMVDKLTREQKQREIDEHISMLEVSAADTVATVADLTTASIRIKNMNDANSQQMQMARDMHARGVAGVADRLSTVIQAVGAAAISESNAMTAQTLNAMSNATDVIAQKESMRIAMGVAGRVESMSKAIEDLAQYGEVNEAAMEFTRQGLAEMRANMDLMERTAREVAESVNASKGVAADVMMNRNPETGSTEEAAPAVKSPFGLRA